MDFLTLLQEKGFLGREFLTWLWFTSEITGGVIPIMPWGPPCTVVFRDRMVLTNDSESKRVVTLTGEASGPQEALAAVLEDKKIEEARISIRRDEDEFTLTLKASWFQFSGLRTPTILPRDDGSSEEDDELATFLEKFALVGKAMDIVDSLFAEFLKRRLSDGWTLDELPMIREWIERETA